MVVPSESESFGIVAIEGMAAGLPVIASDVGGLSEVVTEDCGLLVPAAKPRALADGIRLVCENPGIWEKKHNAAIEHVREKFTVEAMAAKYQRTFSGSTLAERHAGKWMEVLCGLTFFFWCWVVVVTYFVQFNHLFGPLIHFFIV